MILLDNTSVASATIMIVKSTISLPTLGVKGVDLQQLHMLTAFVVELIISVVPRLMGSPLLWQCLHWGWVSTKSVQYRTTERMIKRCYRNEWQHTRWWQGRGENKIICDGSYRKEMIHTCFVLTSYLLAELLLPNNTVHWLITHTPYWDATDGYSHVTNKERWMCIEMILYSMVIICISLAYRIPQ